MRREEEEEGRSEKEKWREKKREGTGGRGRGQEAEGGDRRSGRALMTFKCPFNESLCFLSMVQYCKLLKRVYNIFFERFTHDNHPAVKKAGENGKCYYPSVSFHAYNSGMGRN